MLSLPPEKRNALWQALIERIEHYQSTLANRSVSSPPDLAEIRKNLASVDFTTPRDSIEALDFVVSTLWDTQVHVPHPRYYGLFNPAPSTMGIAADALVAAFNPQLAAWSHSPAACEMERMLVRALGEKFGFDPRTTYGGFTAGGAEANHTAVLVALMNAFPAARNDGVRSIEGDPIIYAGAEGHHSIAKSARMSGLGSDAVREVLLTPEYTIDTAALDEQIRRDIAEGAAPFMIVATAGTTNAGLIDPLARIATIAERHGLWFHVDAAWGGAAVLVPELKPFLDGIQRADSITFDAHKWLSVPMGAGMFLTRHAGVTETAFAIDTSYMPLTADDEIEDPHRHSMQWSRRFIGLKLFLTLMVAGWEGYERALRHQNDMGNLLRAQLPIHGWRVVNDTPLPTVCFVNEQDPAHTDFAALSAIADMIVDSGRAWISATRMGGRLPVLRATITNYATKASDIHRLVDDLDWARATVIPDEDDE